MRHPLLAPHQNFADEGPHGLMHIGLAQQPVRHVPHQVDGDALLDLADPAGCSLLGVEGDPHHVLADFVDAGDPGNVRFDRVAIVDHIVRKFHQLSPRCRNTPGDRAGIPALGQRPLGELVTFTAPSFEGLTNRGGGKRWTGPRPLAVPPRQPTSRRADQLGGIRSRLFPIFLSSRHPPCQRPHHQGQPGEGPDRQYDRAFSQGSHAGEASP